MLTVFIRTYGCQANEADSAGIAEYLSQLGCQLVGDEASADILLINTCAIREKAEQKLYSYLGSLADFVAARPGMKIGVIGCVASYRKKEILKRFSYVAFVSGARDERGTFLAYLADMIVKMQTERQVLREEGVDDAEVLAKAEGRDRVIASAAEVSVATEMSHVESPADRHRDDREIVRDVKASAASGAFDTTAITRDTAVKASLGGIQARTDEVLKSLVNITTGCNNYCTYCIVPFTRGREESYPLGDIIARVRHDVAAGAKEITLIGQNVNSYCCPETGARFAALLEAVAQVPGEFWVRYVSPHPKDMTRDVLEAMARYRDKLCGWCHFPLQAGSDRILDLMKRTYTSAEYRAQIDTIREILPHATITSDIIVGFPGETEEDYEATRAMMEYVKFDQVFSFIYSRRKYTRAYSLGDTCPPAEKQRRLEALQERQKAHCSERNATYVGKTLRVLVEKGLGDGKLLARTEGNHRVTCEGSDSLVGTFQHVLITEAAQAALMGSLVE